MNRPALLAPATLVLGLTACHDAPQPLSWYVPGLVLEAQALELGRHPVGVQVHRTVVLRNAGHEHARITRVEVLPADAPFAAELATRSLPPGATAPLRVTFAPQVAGPRSARLVITHDGDRPIELYLSGEALARLVEVEPSALDFDAVPRATSVARRLRVVAVADLPEPLALTVDSDLDEPPFSILGWAERTPADRTLQAGSALEVDVAFSPTEVGPALGHALEISACPEPACTVRVPLVGVGLAQALACAPARLDLGRVRPGACAHGAVTCRNRGPYAIELAPARLHDDSSPAFLAPLSPEHIEAGSEAAVEVEFCPETLGPHEGQLVFERSDDAHPEVASVTLEGFGGAPDVALSTTRCDLGAVSLLAPARCEIQIDNLGEEALHLLGASIEGEDSDSFTVEEGPPRELPPGARAHLTVHATPTREGEVQATLHLASDDPDTPVAQVDLRALGVSLPPCHYTLPSALSFEDVLPGRTTALDVGLVNEGGGDCLVTEVRLAPGTDPAFELVASPRPGARLAPSSTTPLRVTVAPTRTGPLTGALQLGLSSPSAPFPTIALRAEAVPTGLLAGPDEVDFGACPDPAPRAVRLFAPGPDSVELTRVQVVGLASPFEVEPVPSARLAAGELQEVTVRLAPGAPSPALGVLEVHADVGAQPRIQRVALSARRAPFARRTERFVQAPSDKVDVLIALSFASHAWFFVQPLRAEIDRFLEVARLRGVDFHVGVVDEVVDDHAFSGRLLHTDRARGDGFGGPLDERWVHLETPDAAAVLERNFAAFNLWVEHPQPSCALAAHLALAAHHTLGANAGFSRPDASLAVVCITDEDDFLDVSQSQPWRDLEAAIDGLRAVKGAARPDRFTVAALAVPEGGCPGYSWFSRRLASMTSRTGGRLLPICAADPGEAMATLGDAVFGGRTGFPLAEAPAGPPEVRVDGALLPPAPPSAAPNWWLEPETNTLRFAPHATPEPGARITVEYTAACP